MKDHTQNEPIDLEPNSKPYLLKRIISDCFDVVVIFLLFMIVLVGILNTPIARIYNEHIDHCKEIQEQKKDEFGSDTEAINTALQNDEYYQEEKFAANLHGYLLKLLAGYVKMGRSTPGTPQENTPNPFWPGLDFLE